MAQLTEIRTSKSNHSRLVAKLYDDIGMLEVSERGGRLTICYPLGMPVSYREEVMPHAGSAEPIKDSSGRTACFYYSADNLLEIKKRLRGKTPEGLGGAASAENSIRDQIAQNIRGGLN